MRCAMMTGALAALDIRHDQDGSTMRTSAHRVPAREVPWTP